MILSHQYKFIFLKTSKTAGTSVEIALSKFLGPKDVITPISPEDEETRRDLGYRGPQNYRAKIWEYPYADLVKLVSKLNIPEPLELPRAKSRFRKDKRTAGEILTAEEKARIAQIFEKEITQYGYEI